MAMSHLQKDLEKLTGSARLSNVVDDADEILDLLISARERVAAANDPHTTSLTLTKLQNPVKEKLESMKNNLNQVHRAQNDFNKSLKAAFARAQGTLPTEHDPMEAHTPFINRAIAMHLLREGHFGVASTFIGEEQSQHELDPDEMTPHPSSQHSPSTTYTTTSRRSATPDDAMITDADIPTNLTAHQSKALQEQFAGMYSILTALKNHDLFPAIDWARRNSEELEARGSNLEFELCKLHFIWLFKGPSVNGLPDGPENGVQGALKYGQQNFSRFQNRHLREIQQLSCAMVYAPNLGASPYRSMFDVSLAFDEVSSSFTREFCSLLGLSAVSPLYVAATAGALALPQLVKYTNKMKAKGTEWTTQNELAFETPLPKSMVYHSIFVCPVSKEQTTDTNPPVILPCGHVLAKESLQRLAKGSRYKCPYCPSEGVMKDAKEIIL